VMGSINKCMHRAGKPKILYITKSRK
jgi:hypothetical protein